MRRKKSSSSDCGWLPRALLLLLLLLLSLLEGCGKSQGHRRALADARRTEGVYGLQAVMRWANGTDGQHHRLAGWAAVMQWYHIHLIIKLHKIDKTKISGLIQKCQTDPAIR